MFTFKPWKGNLILALAFALSAWGSFIVYSHFPSKTSVIKSLGATYQTADAVALFTTSLQSSISSSATAFTLNAGTYNNGATTLASSTYGMIIDEGTATEELVLADCTGTTCTNVTRGLDRQTGTTTVAALQFAHRRSASVKITDAPTLLFAMNVFKGRQNIENALAYNSALAFSTSSNQIPSALWISGVANVASTSAFNQITAGANTFTAIQTFNVLPVSSVAPTGGTQLTNKTYVDGVAIAGAADASYTTKGIVERATVSEISSGATSGGTTAPLFMSPSDFQYSTFASTTFIGATTTAYSAPTTTISNIPAKDYLVVFFVATSTSPAGDNTTAVNFNGDVTATYGFQGIKSISAGNASIFGVNQTKILLSNPIGTAGPVSINMRIHNEVGMNKTGEVTFTGTDTSGDAYLVTYSFVWRNLAQINSISIGEVNGKLFATSTYMRVSTY